MKGWKANVNTIKKRGLILGSTLTVLFSVFTLAQALTLEQQLIDTAEQEYTAGNQTSYYQLPTGSVIGTPEQLIFKVKGDGGSGSFSDSAVYCGNGTATTTFTAGSTTYTDTSAVYTKSLTVGSGDGVVASDDSCYLYFIGSGGFQPEFKGASSNVYGGRFSYDDQKFGLEDLYFILSSTVQGPDIAEDFIEIITPSANSTTTSNVSVSIRGLLSTSNFTSTTTDMVIMITPTGGSFASTTPIYLRFPYLTYDSLQSNSYSLTLATGNYSIGAWFEFTDTNTRSSIQDYQFFSVNFTGTFFNVPLNQQAVNILNSQQRCESITSDYSWWGQLTAGSLCRMAMYLFMPTSPISDTTGELVSVLKTRFPFNTLFQLNDTFQNQTQSASTSPDVVYSGVSGFGSNPQANLTLFSSTSYQTSNALTRIRLYTSYILYFVFGLLIFWRIKKFV